MITDEELDELPDDNEVAFIQYEAILRKRLDTNAANWASEREYAAYILAFLDLRKFDLDIPTDPPLIDAHFSNWFADFTKSLHSEIARLRVAIALRKKVNVTVLRLSQEFKTQIGAHLMAIRNIVADADISESKRDAILRRISSLQQEVDRDRTRTEAAMALLLEVTSAISKGAKNLDPAIDRLQRIIGIFAEQKNQSEHDRLTAPPERKRIEPPKRQASSPTQDDDSEIPF